MTHRMYRALVLLLVAAAIVLAVAWRLQAKPRSSAPTVAATATENDSGIAAPAAQADEPTGDEPDTQTTPDDAPEAASADNATTPEYPAVIDLGKGECIPCKEMKPILDQLAEEYKGRCRVEIIDIGERPDQSDRYDVVFIPTQIFFDGDGNEVFRHTGFMPKEDIVAKLREMGVE